MSGSAVGVMVIVILVLLLLKVPVFISILAGCGCYFFMTPDVAGQIFAQRVIVSCENTALLAIPFFVCSGVFMNYSGVTERIMDFCVIATGRMSGGLAQVNVLLSTLMGGLSGSNLADAAMEAKMLVPEMEKKGFSKSFSTVVTACSSIITPLIPPGIQMILYGITAGVSVGKLFIGGIGPGVLLCITLMMMVSVISKKRGYQPIRKEKLSVQEGISVIKKAILPLMLPIVIIGGIRLGIFSPTEAGAVSIIYALVLAIGYKEFTKANYKSVVTETVLTTASIMAIIGSASLLSWILTVEQIPQALAESIVSYIDNRWVFLILVNILLLIVGMFIEGSSATIILAPLLAPVARKYGIDDIQFAMIFIFNTSFGTITPPMGTIMFVTCGITGCKLKEFLKEVVPFYLIFVICLILLSTAPFLTTGIVNLLY